MPSIYKILHLCMYNIAWITYVPLYLIFFKNSVEKMVGFLNNFIILHLHDWASDKKLVVYQKIMVSFRNRNFGLIIIEYHLASKADFISTVSTEVCILKSSCIYFGKYKVLVAFQNTVQRLSSNPSKEWDNQ